jgi:hypothetical protein
VDVDLVARATKARGVGAATLFEAKVVKGRTMTGISKKRTFGKLARDLAEVPQADASVHAARLAYSKAAAK